MSSVIVFMYSGQGSQYYQMGRSLFEENNIFRTAMLKADQLYQDMTGSSVLKILYADQNTLGLPFIETLVTHPAIFMIEYALTEVLFSLNIRPNLVLGSSLGEFAAMVTAGVLSFETALTTVIKKAQILQQYCPPGGMMAILHNVELFDTHAWLYENAELAAINFDSHFVIAASPEN
jgi:bacillaene synthase trans-acting acyltransferase